jgi:hypothetical protein
MHEKSDKYKVLVGICEEKSHLGNLGIDRRVILKWILKK